MIGSTRSRRLGAVLAGAALVVTVAGCTVGTSAVPAGQQFDLIECTAGPTPGTYWRPGPGARHLRFQVLSSDATQQLEALVFSVSPDQGASFGTVWDGTKSTGPKTVAYPGNDIPLVLWAPNGPAAQTVNATWAFAALDADGKDVGLTCVG
jgi:hypothetical protein